jgi:hypothetical protein
VGRVWGDVYDAIIVIVVVFVTANIIIFIIIIIIIVIIIITRRGLCPLADTSPALPCSGSPITPPCTWTPPSKNVNNLMESTPRASQGNTSHASRSPRRHHHRDRYYWNLV